MMINSILSLLLAGGLLTTGGCLAAMSSHGQDLDALDDDELLDGLSDLTPRERRRRLAVYRRRVRDQIAEEQEMAWLRARIKGYVGD